MQFADFLDCLQCPVCTNGLEFKSVEGANRPDPALDGHFGVLSCGCSKYPVIADIPVLMEKPLGLMSHWNDGAVYAGPTPGQIVSLIEKGDWQEALIQALVFPQIFPGHWRLSGKPYWPTRLTRRAGLVITRQRLDKLLFKERRSLTVKAWTDLFFAKRSGNNDYLSEYFSAKVTMPRFLSAMALVQRLPKGREPVVDLACGMGHVAGYLTERAASSQAIGIDLNFHQLWGARHLIARKAWFVCGDFGAGLPIKSGRASAVICSDAFQFLPDKPMTMGEIERIAPGEPIIVARAGSLGVGPANPPWGGELTPGGYLELLGPERTRIFADDRLWKDYLLRRDPLVQTAPNLDDLAWEKYLSFAVNWQALDPMPSSEERRPHALGQLVVNPYYRVVESGASELDLQFGFSSIWGAYEDADMSAYVQKWVTLEKGLIEKGIADPESDTARDLIERFILIGTPAH